ncbi:OmpA family protein [Oceanobacter kriegii]|uniref:OmpA family protein n=1 Tax=Oceanobacter kriegii TaxID=64972 RepID=UPI0003FBBAF3|nr:OmpA family protein [Oceanobacter kriegii]
MKYFALATALAVSITGCSTYDAYTGEEKTSNTAIGASIGASVGAVAAYLANKDEKSGTRNRRILAAAAGGGAIGGGVGYYMDSQEAELRKQLRGTGVSVQRVGDNVNLIMPGNITFGSGRTAIASNFYEVLDSVAVVLEEYDKTLVVVAGHTDSDGSEAFNQQLSEDRAHSVAEYLKVKGINEVRLEPVGFGESEPIASNSTAEGKALNRRVEITLMPATEE